MCPEATVSKKKRVCVRIVPVGSVDTAVLDIKLTAKSKMMLQHHTYVGLVTLTYTNILSPLLSVLDALTCLFHRDIHGYVLWCRKGYFSNLVPQAKPRSISLDLRRLSLEHSSAPQPLRPRYSTSENGKLKSHYRLGISLIGKSGPNDSLNRTNATQTTFLCGARSDTCQMLCPCDLSLTSHVAIHPTFTSLNRGNNSGLVLLAGHFGAVACSHWSLMTVAFLSIT